METSRSQYSKKITVQRGENGFGFTLRHFLVYPQQSDKNCRGKPLETTFVQTVNKDSPAKKCGLQEGDRILSVNGQSVSGKTYKDIVQLVQESPDHVDLLLVSRQDDILQMAFSPSSFQAQPGTHWSKTEPKTKRQDQPELPDYHQHQFNQRKKFSSNNNSNKIKFAKFQQTYYDTLDSAYSTGESSYNTVDSSYNQRPSSEFYTKQLPVFQPFKSRSAFTKVTPKHEELRYVDNVNDSDSDTATETETEHSPNFLASSDEVNMSYVPDYVRPVLPASMVATVTTSSSSFTTSRPVQTLTLTSPSTSLASSKVSSPNVSRKDPEQLASPRGTTFFKHSNHNNTSSYAGYRENYIRQQKEKLCGRKSLNERLKSLESGASVKLQVSKGSQKRRKSIENKESRAKQTEEALNSRSSAIPKTQDVQKEVEPLKAPQQQQPPPDIIESHQPKNFDNQESNMQ